MIWKRRHTLGFELQSECIYIQHAINLTTEITCSLRGLIDRKTLGIMLIIKPQMKLEMFINIGVSKIICWDNVIQNIPASLDGKDCDIMSYLWLCTDYTHIMTTRNIKKMSLDYTSSK